MRRRQFITLLGGAAAWPFAARAQDNGRTYRLGFLLPSSRHGVVDAFFDELRLNGFVEGKNLVVMPGGFEATDDNLAERAAALVNAAPDAIVAGPAPPLRALQAITRTIPLIGMSEDMVGEGLVASLDRPGANITGIDDGVARAMAYEATGVDSIFFTGISTRAELEKARAATKLPIVLGTTAPEIDDIAYLTSMKVCIANQGHTPFAAASATKSWPSYRSPRTARKRSPACARRASRSILLNVVSSGS